MQARFQHDRILAKLQFLGDHSRIAAGAGRLIGNPDEQVHGAE